MKPKIRLHLIDEGYNNIFYSGKVMACVRNVTNLPYTINRGYISWYCVVGIERHNDPTDCR